jgi:hypothetical protein
MSRHHLTHSFGESHGRSGRRSSDDRRARESAHLPSRRGGDDPRTVPRELTRPSGVMPAQILLQLNAAFVARESWQFWGTPGFPNVRCSAIEGKRVRLPISLVSESPIITLLQAKNCCAEKSRTREVVVPSNAVLLVMIISAIAAACSAFFSWRSSRVAAKALQATLYLKLQEQYASQRMLDDLHNLRTWRDKHGQAFVSRWAERHRNNDEEAKALNESRRRVVHFFCAIADLYSSGLLPRHLRRLLTDFQGIDLLYDVAEPLEMALNPDYDKSCFDTLRRLKISSGRGQPTWSKPETITRSPEPK